MPLGMAGDCNIKKEKGIKLKKEYIIGKMKWNPIYGAYVPSNIAVHKLSRGFLLKVRLFLFISLVYSIHW